MKFLSKLKQIYPEFVITATLIAFGGFVTEVLFRFIRFNEIVDRGFLTLPLNPIYGIPVMLMFFIIKIPERNGSTIKYIGKIIVYAFACASFFSVVEFVVGNFFYYVMDIRLWRYSETLDTFLNGFVNFEFFLIWLAISPLIPLFVKPLVGLISKIRKKYLIATIIVLLIIGDFICSTFYIYRHGHTVDMVNIVLRFFHII